MIGTITPEAISSLDHISYGVVVPEPYPNREWGQARFIDLSYAETRGLHAGALVLDHLEGVDTPDISILADSSNDRATHLAETLGLFLYGDLGVRPLILNDPADIAPSRNNRTIVVADSDVITEGLGVCPTEPTRIACREADGQVSILSTGPWNQETDGYGFTERVDFRWQTFGDARSQLGVRTDDLTLSNDIVELYRAMRVAYGNTNTGRVTIRPDVAPMPAIF